MIKAIIFDLDGLLIDSTPLLFEATKLVFSEVGHSLKKEDWYLWVHGGMDSKKWIEINNLPISIEEMRSKRQIIYEELVATKLKLKPGAKKLINFLKGKFKISLGSANHINWINICIDKFGLRTKFDYIASSVDLKKQKPDPEVFLHLAKKMNVKPDECVVLEDSLLGLQTAKAAGMKCIICPDDTMFKIPHDSYTGADKIVKSLEEVNLKMINELK